MSVANGPPHCFAPAGMSDSADSPAPDASSAYAAAATCTPPVPLPRCAPRGPPALPLRLPDIKPLPQPSDEELRIRRGAADMASPRHGNRSSGLGLDDEASRTRRRVSSTGGSGSSFDDFLGNSPRSGSRRSGNLGRPQRVPPRPTRRAIDDDTAVPADVFEKMLRLGNEARARATHTLAFEPPLGKPYLRHHNAAARVGPATECPEEPVFAIPPLPLRPPSACASEVGRSDFWGRAADLGQSRVHVH